MILHQELWDLKVVVHELLGETRLELDSIFIFQDIFEIVKVVALHLHERTLSQNTSYNHIVPS